MATESTTSTSLPIRPSKHSSLHPFAPLTADEIRTASSVIKSQWPADTELHFKAVTLEEPPKAEAVPYVEAEFHGGKLPNIDRKAMVNYYIKRTVQEDHAFGSRDPC